VKIYDQFVAYLYAFDGDSEHCHWVQYPPLPRPIRGPEYRQAVSECRHINGFGLRCLSEKNHQAFQRTE